MEKTNCKIEILTAIFYGLFSLGINAEVAEITLESKFTKQKLVGCEDIEIFENSLYFGSKNGSIYQLDLPSQNLNEIYRYSGRPLGIAVRSKNEIFVIDPLKGILQVDLLKKTHRQLVAPGGKKQFNFLDDIAYYNNRLYFTNASKKYRLGQSTEAIVTQEKGGSVWIYDLGSGDMELIKEGLVFANGIDIGPRGEKLYFTETGSYRVYEYEIQSKKIKQLASGLPGFPDNLTVTSDGILVALFSPQSKILNLFKDNPTILGLLNKIPHWLKPLPPADSQIVKLDFKGKIVEHLLDTDSDFFPVTSVVQYRENYYFGSLKDQGLGFLAKKIID